MGRSGHDYNCDYPSEPCSCYAENPERRRTSHESWCFYPSDPCCCNLEKAERGECE